MIAPHELKNKTFSRAVRGYNPADVDQYFDFLIEKYTEAYKTSLELEQKLNKLQAKYSELSGEEESIRSAILKAQKLGEAIVNNANKEAAAKEEELKARCEAIVQETKDRVEAEKNNILTLRKMAIEFRNSLCGHYMQHIESIQAMDLNHIPRTDDGKEEAALDQAKADIVGETANPAPEKTLNSASKNEE